MTLVLARLPRLRLLCIQVGTILLLSLATLRLMMIPFWLFAKILLLNTRRSAKTLLNSGRLCLL